MMIKKMMILLCAVCTAMIMTACYPPADQVEISVLDIMKTNGLDVKGVTLNHDGGNKYSGSALIREKGIFGTKDVPYEVTVVVEKSLFSPTIKSAHWKEKK